MWRENFFAFLMKAFGFKQNLINRGELVVYHAINFAVPELRLSERVLDASIAASRVGKTKSAHDPRSDAYHQCGAGSRSFGIIWE